MIRTALALGALLLASSANAETLVSNINGIQVGPNGKLQHFTGLLIGDDGKVRSVLTGAPPPKTFEKMIDGEGRTVLPGLVDAHGHVMDLGASVLILKLTGAKSIADLQERLRTYAAAHADDPWISGFGWNQELWPVKTFPTAADLDAVIANRPVVLERVDGHAIVVNSAAMKAAGVTAATRDVPGGKIERDAQGNPTGLFVDNARDLIERSKPAPSSTQEDRALAAAQQELLSFGVTSVGDMASTAEAWNAYKRAGDRGLMRVRIFSYAFGPDNLARISRRGPTAWLYGDHLKLNGMKLFADGALGSRGAWLKQSYADQPDTRGLPRHSDAEIMELAEAAAARGFQVATHAIGDAANAQVISMYEQLSKKYGRDRRWRIEHFQIADPTDIPRLAPAGIIASMQPTHQTSDRLMAEQRLGPERLKGAYAWQSVLKSGARLAFGTDFPVESPNPFPGLAAAVSRQDINRQPPGGWIPSERLTLEQALSAYTRGAAYAGFAENKIGALEPGKYADFIIVDRDPTSVDPQALARTQVLETWVGGKKVWERPTIIPAAPTERGK
jgi:predicted amidohydrolase YtcJ